MSDGPREIGRVPYVPADRPLIVGVQDGMVTVGCVSEPFWRLNAEQRDTFSRLYFDAEAEAEKWQQEHEEANDAR